MADGLGMGGTIAQAAVSGIIKGGASGSGLLSTPFKAAQKGGNIIKGIAKNLNKVDKKPSQKSRFKVANPQQKQLNSANKVANKFASNVKVPPVVPNQPNVGKAIKQFNKKPKVSKPFALTYEDKVKKALGMRV